MMRAPDDFQPQLVNTSTIPYAAAPAWLRSQRYPGEETFVLADQHAMQVAQEQHDSFKDLLFHLVYTERWSDVEAARVLFRWMTSKNMYTVAFAGVPPGSPEELIMGFRDGKSTFCRIYELLCLYSGIPCITVVGYAKGIEVRPGQSLQDQKFNHSWNVVFVDDTWQLVDCHWATRFLQSNDSNVPENLVYEYDDFYFFPDPEALIYSHFPEDPKWQLLKKPLSMYDFESLPIAKSAFFRNDLKFLSHHEGVIPTQNGCVSLSLGNYNPLSFTFKLLFGESCRDELGGIKLVRYGLQETQDGQVNLFVRAPVKGFYYLTLYSTQIKRSVQDESVYNAVCEYKLICDVPFPNAEPYPFVSDSNWGPGAEVYQAGLIPNIRDAVIVAPDGHIELDFEKVRNVRVLPKLTSAHATEKQCEQAITQDDNEHISRVDIDLPVNGEYALEIYANEPARDGNTYTHVCQYLLVKPKKGDNSASLLYHTPAYNDCYNVHGMREPLQPVSMSLEQLARGMNDLRVTDPLALEPRPSAKQAALTGVELEQVSLPSKSKPGTAPKPPPKAEKPAVPGKPAPKPKPKPSASSMSGSGSGSVGGPGSVADWRSPDSLQHGSEDYANLPLSGGQVGMQGAYPGDEFNTAPGSLVMAGYGRTPQDGYQQPYEYQEEAAHSAATSHQGAPPGRYTDLGYAPVPFKGGRGQAGYEDLEGPHGRYGSQSSGPGYGTDDGSAYRGEGDPRYGGEMGPGYGRDGEGRYGREGEVGYGRDPTGYGGVGGPEFAGREGYDEYGRPLAGYGHSQDDLERHGGRGGGDDDMMGGGDYGGRDPRGRGYNQPGMSMKTEKKSKIFAIFSTSKTKKEKHDKEDKKSRTDKKDKTDDKNDRKLKGGKEPSQIPAPSNSLLQPFKTYPPNKYGKFPTDYVPVNITGLNPSLVQSLSSAKSSLPSSKYLSTVSRSSKNSTSSKSSSESTKSSSKTSPTSSQSSVKSGDEDFPAPPPVSDMLNMEFAPERTQAEIPIAPTSFEPIHIADPHLREVDTQLSNVPKPVPPQLEENLVFSAERAHQFKTVDTHAVQVAKTEHNSFRDLIWDLIYDKNITDDLEKARVIFLWLCTKDLSKMQFRNVQNGSPEEILLNVKQGKASYAQIYETLCSYAGLHCRVIRGYAKGADYKPGMKFRGTQAFHAWNSVLVHGHWRLIDCHWASRRMFGKKGTEHIRYELDDYYFCVDARQLIYTHFPEDKQWQLLEHPYELDEFENLPLVKSLFFRYCLQLESHTFATVMANDEFVVTVNYEYYRGPGLEFTFSLHTDEGDETVSAGMPLSRFGVMETTNDGKANFRIRPPAIGVYKLAVYAREVQMGETTNRMYCAVVEYRLEVGAVPPHIVPYPACSGTTWGISPGSAKKHGLTTKFTSGVLYTRNGQSEIRFKLHRQLLFSGKLKSNVYPEKDLQSCILYRTVGETAIFSVSVPAPGEYGLEVFVNDPTVDGKTLRHMCQYLLVCEEPQVSGIRFPQLPAAYLGPQQAYTRLGMNTISNKDPLIHCTSGAIEVSFSTTTPLRATSNLILTAGQQDMTEYILQQFRDNTLSFQIRLPKAGIYKFQIFAQLLDDSSDSLPGVYNYLINCSSVPSPPIPFPKQFSQWKEGCYLYTPIDGDLAAAQVAQDPTPNYIFYQVAVPNASRVAVVVGGEWTHLELSTDGIWEGAAFFQAGWGKEDTAALTANYGSDNASYNTLLEFRM